MKVNLSKKDFNEILENYNIGKYKSHRYIFTGGNTVYKLTTTKANFILKIYAQKTPLEYVKYQIKLMEFLNKTKVSTPKIINTKNDKGLLIWNNNKIAIQEFANGQGIEYVNEKLAKDMGKQYGILDKTLSKFKEKKCSHRERDMFKLIEWNINSFIGLDLKEESKKLFIESKKINKNKLRKGLIHGDLCEGNFLAKEDKVSAIIDWDDVHEDYLVVELAVPIAHNMVTKVKVMKKQIRIFLREYQKYIKLNSEEKKAIYYAVKRRELSAGSWCYNQIKKHPSKRKELLRWTSVCLKRYKSFCKISLEEFLELF